MENSAYKSYIKEINQFPLLTASQEKELSFKILNGDVKSKQKLINSNLRLVVQIACKFAKNEESVMDAIQEGNIGLMHAASKFDYRFNTKFSTYAHYWIQEYIRRFRNNEKDIHIPSKIQETIRIIENAKSILTHNLEKIPSVEELSLFTGIGEKEVEEYLGFNYNVSSLDCFFDTEKDYSMYEMLTDNRANPEFEVLDLLEKKSFTEIINTLPERERFVIQQRYNGYKIGRKTTYRSISEKTGLSIEGARQVEMRANSKLKPLFQNYLSEVIVEKIPI